MSHDNVRRPAPTYTHVDIGDFAPFSITGGPLGTYLSREIGDATHDLGCAAFFGDHVHDNHVSASGNTQITRNTRSTPRRHSAATLVG